MMPGDRTCCGGTGFILVGDSEGEEPCPRCAGGSPLLGGGAPDEVASPDVLQPAASKPHPNAGCGDVDCESCDGSGVECVDCGFTQDDPLSPECESCGGELQACRGCSTAERERNGVLVDRRDGHRERVWPEPGQALVLGEGDRVVQPAASKLTRADVEAALARADEARLADAYVAMISAYERTEELGPYAVDLVCAVLALK